MRFPRRLRSHEAAAPPEQLECTDSDGLGVQMEQLTWLAQDNKDLQTLSSVLNPKAD